MRTVQNVHAPVVYALAYKYWCKAVLFRMRLFRAVRETAWKPLLRNVPAWKAGKKQHMEGNNDYQQ